MRHYSGEGFFDLHCKVVDVKYDSDMTVFWVWDGTDACPFPVGHDSESVYTYPNFGCLHWLPCQQDHPPTEASAVAPR